MTAVKYPLRRYSTPITSRHAASCFLDPLAGWKLDWYEHQLGTSVRLRIPLKRWGKMIFASFGKAIEFVEELIEEGKLP